ncbi:MAG: hypothetical protein H7Y37_04930 [Anaerolineae bacterium]|nr:hypothetical protein [Gloeobacterales cyanobacterium ES-bin-313]
MSYIARVALAIFVLGFTAVAVHAETAKPSDAPKTPNSQLSAPVSGLVVVKDPVTGRWLQPTAQDMQKLTPPPSSTTNSTQQPEIFTGVGGAQGVKLGTDSMVYMVVNKSPNGQLTETCVTGEKAAQSQMVHPGVPTTSAQNKEVLDVE